MIAIRVALIAAGLVLLASCSSATVGSAGDAGDLAAAQRDITPLLQEMSAAANAHDTDRHMAYYIRSKDLVFVMNDEAIPGFDSLRVRQLQWWQNGKSDVVYEIVGMPQYRMPAPGVVVQTYFLRGTRTVGGVARASSFGITAVWQKRPEGWRITYAHEAMVAR